MKKSDLKDGMRVVLRDGEEYIIAGNMIDNMESWDYLENYNEDLTSIGFSKLDIVKIYDWEDIQGEFPRRKKITVWERPWIPEEDEVYYIPNINSRREYLRYDARVWENDEYDEFYYNNNLIFKTQDEAIECANRMLNLTKEGRLK